MCMEPGFTAKSVVTPLTVSSAIGLFMTTCRFVLSGLQQKHILCYLFLLARTYSMMLLMG